MVFWAHWIVGGVLVFGALPTRWRIFFGVLFMLGAFIYQWIERDWQEYMDRNDPRR